MNQQIHAFRKRLLFLNLVLSDLASAGVQPTDDKFDYVSKQHAAVQAKLQELEGAAP